MRKNFLVLSMLCLLSSCTSNLNQESIQSYNNNSLNQFIKNRFTINNTFNEAIQNGLSMATPNKQHNLYEYYARSKTLVDGSYVFYATFPGKEMLEKPKNDLSLFCGMKGGSLNTITDFSSDILSLHETNSIQAYLVSVQELSRARVTFSDGSTSITRSLSSSEINSIATGEAIRVSKENRYSDLEFAKKYYFSAMKDGSFGAFNCVDHASKRILWRVSIIPIAYEPADKEHFISDALYVGIKGEEIH